MPSLSIQLPVIEADKDIEIEIKINGSAKRYRYRVEIVPWDECPDPSEKIQCLKQSIQKHAPEWQLIQIGAATEDNIPLMFRVDQ